MTTVRIIKNWDTPDIMRQTPGHTGRWKDIQFTTDPVAACDYVVVCNWTTQRYTVAVPNEHIWCLLQEPPNEFFLSRHAGQPVYSQIFTQDPTKQGPRYVLSHPALPWHIGKSYDELKSQSSPEKSKGLSWITSSKTQFQGHKRRMKFLSQLHDRIPFDLYGHGFHTIADKWDGLASYRYAIAVENFQGPYYWSEKLADCFLSWTVPLYYGCTNITDYFPEESIIKIDIEDPDSIRYIEDIIRSDEWKKRREAIAHARQLILEQYQFFPYISDRIHAWEKRYPTSDAIPLVIPNQDSLLQRVKNYVSRL